MAREECPNGLSLKGLCSLSRSFCSLFKTICMRDRASEIKPFLMCFLLRTLSPVLEINYFPPIDKSVPFTHHLKQNLEFFVRRLETFHSTDHDGLEQRNQTLRQLVSSTGCHAILSPPSGDLRFCKSLFQVVKMSTWPVS